MSPEEYSIVAAARNIVYVKCVVGDEPFPATELARSAAMLATPNRSRTSPYGLWDAALVAVKGYLGVDFDLVGLYDIGRTLGEDVVAEKFECQTDQAVTYLLPTVMGTIYFGGNPEDFAYFDALNGWYFDAGWAASRDSRIAAFSEALGRCFAVSGYSLQKARSGDEHPPLLLQMEDTWSEEQKFQAGVVAATCNDQLGVTQALSDVKASYEQLIIEAHEAELVAIRAEVELRIARAHEVLRDMGLE
jgi:hypothetical protein